MLYKDMGPTVLTALKNGYYNLSKKRAYEYFSNIPIIYNKIISRIFLNKYKVLFILNKIKLDGKNRGILLLNNGCKKLMIR